MMVGMAETRPRARADGQGAVSRGREDVVMDRDRQAARGVVHGVGGGCGVVMHSDRVRQRSDASSRGDANAANEFLAVASRRPLRFARLSPE
jgi:hypothetical protein